MGDIKKIPFASSEIAGLWNSYMSDTLTVCFLKHCLTQVECEETRALMQQTSDLLKQHIQEATDLFNEEELPTPVGYSDKDVNLNAPRLFTDHYYLQYLSFISRIAMHNYTLILNQLARLDIRDFFSKRIREYNDLYNRSTDLKLTQGVAVRAPTVEVLREVQYVKGQSFIFDWFGEKRPMLAAELTYIYSIINQNLIGRAISTGFGQVSKIKKSSDCFFHGSDLEGKHIQKLTSLLTEEGIPIPSSSDLFVTDSSVAPFSEKLMLNHAMVLSASRISSIGIAMANTLRSDIQTILSKYLEEDLAYSKDGADILIENAWLEQSPQNVDHKKLVMV